MRPIAGDASPWRHRSPADEPSRHCRPAAAPLPTTLRRASPADAGAAHQCGGEGTALMQAACNYADRWAQLLRLALTVFVDNARVDVLSMARLHPIPPRPSGCQPENPNDDPGS